MHHFHFASARVTATAVVLGWFLCLAGCSNGPRRAAPVNAELAQSALQKALDSWKNGARPASLKNEAPPIIVQDMDWQMGYRLVDYRVHDPIYDDANLRCPVTLTVLSPQGRKLDKNVTYMVGTDPAVTVFREIPM